MDAKTCPVCGSKSKLDQGHRGADTSKTYYAFGCSGSKKFGIGCLHTKMFEDQSQALETWNKRAPRTILDGHLSCAMCGAQAKAKKTPDLVGKFYPHMVECLTCGTHTPAMKSGKEAWQLWGETE